ncbi:MAG: hypothetical protein IJ124_05180 [Clostridia bacterium]|nr:hypothetical protein [Clostridia bacterium]MBQ8708102.1 hypothetical protein [Succinivibrionaceae bacterium]MBQ8708148.1 hypothetical protein [Succinivibrionaceae bacterium]
MPETRQTPLPDCAFCWLRDTCADAEPGKFCTYWQSREPEKREPDPNDLWNRGEEAVF